jgi:DNA-binding SARP family transcriptional activator
MGTENPAVVQWQPVAVRALVQLGEVPAALALLQETLAGAHRFGAPGLIARLTILDDEVRNRPAAPPSRRATGQAAAGSSILVLGEAAIVRDERSTPLTRDQADRVVRLVAVHERGLHLEEAIDHLWPDADLESGRTRLRNVMTRIRRRHGDIVVREGDRLVLADGVQVDVREFEALATKALTGTEDEHRQAGNDALARYGGDLLPTDPYAAWATLPRERARTRWLHLRDTLAARAAEAGRIDEAMRLLGPAIDAQPLDEDRLVTGARWLVEAGRRAGAKALLERARVVCADLGVAPSDALLEVEARLHSA